MQLKLQNHNCNTEATRIAYILHSLKQTTKTCEEKSTIKTQNHYKKVAITTCILQYGCVLFMESTQ